MAKDNGSGSAVGGLVVFVFVLIAIVPKWLWITLGAIVGVLILTWAIYKVSEGVEHARAEAREQARLHAEAEAARAAKQRDEAMRQARRKLVGAIGEKSATRVDSARAAVKKVVASEAARAGWLGDVDFNADIQGIVDNFAKAHSLRRVAEQLAALDKPSADDRRILAEATTTIAELETAAVERVELIGKCATEAQLIDESLRNERKDAQTAEQRAELHAKLSALLYGIEAAPAVTATDSTADAVLARVQAYREIKNQIQLSRDGWRQ